MLASVLVAEAPVQNVQEFSSPVVELCPSPDVEVVAVGTAGHSPGHCWSMGLGGSGFHIILYLALVDSQPTQQPQH